MKKSRMSKTFKKHSDPVPITLVYSRFVTMSILFLYWQQRVGFQVRNYWAPYRNNVGNKFDPRIRRTVANKKKLGSTIVSTLRCYTFIEETRKAKVGRRYHFDFFRLWSYGVVYRVMFFYVHEVMVSLFFS